MSRVLKSFYETHIRFLEAIRESGLDEEAVNELNKSIKWVKNKEGKPVMLALNSFSFNFYPEREFFMEKERIYQTSKHKNIDWDEYFEEKKKNTQIERPFLIITTTMPYGYYLEYLNKQKKKSYHS